MLNKPSKGKATTSPKKTTGVSLEHPNVFRFTGAGARLRMLNRLESNKVALIYL